MYKQLKQLRLEKSFQTFQRFNDRNIAEEIAERLQESQIESIITEDKKYFDPGFANNQIEPTILKLFNRFMSFHTSNIESI